MLTEAEGCAVLAQVFAARGYAIARDVPFAEGGVRFSMDGWDAQARVGFEFLTREAGDHDELSAGMMTELAERMERGELYVFLLDEIEVVDADELAWAANAFLDEVARRGGGPGAAHAR